MSFLEYRILRNQYSYSQDHSIRRSWWQQVSSHHQIHPLKMVPPCHRFDVEVGLDEEVASYLIDGTLFFKHQSARKPPIIFHIATGPPHQMVEVNILLHLVLMPLTQLANHEAPDQL